MAKMSVTDLKLNLMLSVEAEVENKTPEKSLKTQSMTHLSLAKMRVCCVLHSLCASLAAQCQQDTVRDEL